MANIVSKLLRGETKLERAVARILNRKARDYKDTGIEGVLADLMRGGCASGYIGELVNTTAGAAFYGRHQKEIDAFIVEMVEGQGGSASDLVNWDSADPLAREQNNQNVLAWFGFEEAARDLAARAGIEY